MRRVILFTIALVGLVPAGAWAEGAPALNHGQIGADLVALAGLAKIAAGTIGFFPPWRRSAGVHKEQRPPGRPGPGAVDGPGRRGAVICACCGQYDRRFALWG